MLKRVRIGDVNPHIICVLCGGYLVDATTIVECLHSFCRSCIVKYLYSSFHCPVCDVEVHKTRPLLHIRSDPTLQDIVFKLVPGLYYDELRRRKEAESGQNKELAAGGLENHTNKEVEEHKEEKENTDKNEIQMDDPMFVTLEYYRRKRNRAEQEVFPTRYLRCPSAVTVSVLKKFLVMKFTIPPTHQPEIIRCDEIIDSHLTIKEVSQIYGLYAKSFLDVQYAFLDAEFQVPRTPKVKKTKKQKTRHFEHPAAAETISKANKDSLGSKPPNGFLTRPAVGEDDLKPSLLVGKEDPPVIEAKESITMSPNNDKQVTLPHLESTLPSPFVSLNTNPPLC